MEYCADSPVKKKKNNLETVRPKRCIIHIDPRADDLTLSRFTEQSWKVRFCNVLHILVCILLSCCCYCHCIVTCNIVCVF